MITNNLLIKLKDRNNENMEEIKAALLSMKGKIEVLQDLQVQSDILGNELSYDVLLITYFSSPKDMDAYLIHPVHVETSKYIQSFIAAVATVCYES